MARKFMYGDASHEMASESSIMTNIDDVISSVANTSRVVDIHENEEDDSIEIQQFNQKRRAASLTNITIF